MNDSTGLAYAVFGIGLSAGGAVLGFMRGRSSHSYYAAQVYHMTARSHRRFGALSLAFLVAFILALHWSILDIPLLAVYVLALILYVSSFARGFSGEDE